MHHLVPHFILEKLEQEQFQGSFACAALFVDISGFTRLTEALMEHGQYGAEVLASVMRTIFTPLITTIYEQNGFITGFAGDAFTAVFPTHSSPTPAELHALAAAVRIQHTMASQAWQETRFGVFEFTVKIGLSTEYTTWGILQSEDRARATYYFKGPAIDDCTLAQQYASAGQIVCSPSYLRQVEELVRTSSVGDHHSVERVHGRLPPPVAVSQPPAAQERAANFYPRSLLERDLPGEFRQTLNLFIGLQGVPAHDQLHEFIQQVFRLQERYGGFLSRVDFGDKGCHLLFFWGAPVSHEHDLAHVLDFVLDLRQATSIRLRAGLTYQIAHAGYIGSSLAEEYTCYGRGVNLAARLMTGAEWGDIWLDRHTAQRAHSEFEVEAMGTHDLKGFAEPQEIYSLRDRRRTLTSRFAGKPLVGRQHELTLLRRALLPIFAGEFGGSIAVIGEAGVGKSRLVDALCGPLVHERKASLFFCQADELLRQSLNPFSYFLLRYFDQSSTDSEETNKRRFWQKLEALINTVPEPQLRDQLRRTHSFLGNLIGLRWENSLYEQLDAELRFDNTLEGLKALFKAESLRRPLIIHLEDAHWWDQDTQTFLSRLVRNVEAYPFVLLITSRNELPEDLFESPVSVEQLVLQGLGQEEISTLAQAILGYGPTSSLIKILEERTDGNPFFLEQLLLYLDEQNLLQRLATTASQELVDDVYVPTDVRAVLTARLDRLPLEIRDVVQEASVLGHEFETPILAAMIGHTSSKLAEYLAAGESERIWLPSSSSTYVFRHAIFRDAAYDMQLGARLRSLHELAARAFLERYTDSARADRYAEIAFHFDRAEKGDDARHYYGAAAEHAKNQYRNENAIAYFGRALALTDAQDFEARYRYLAERETIFQWLGNSDRRQRDLDQLTELLADQSQPQLQADLAMRLSSHAFVLGDYDMAVHQVQAALSAARDVNDIRLEAQAYHRWGRTLVLQGRSHEAESLLQMALGRAAQVNDETLIAACLTELAGAARMQSMYGKARDFLLQAKTIYTKLQDEQGLIRCLTLFGVVDNDLGYFAESEAYYLQALDRAHETGWRFAETYILVNIGGNKFETGDFEEGGAYLERALAIAEETGDLRTQANSLDTLGLIAHYQGQLETGMQYYDRAGHILATIDNKRELGYVLTHVGYLAIELGRYDRARADLIRALRLRQQLGSEALTLDTLAGLAFLAMSIGQLEEAVSTAETIYSAIAENGTEGIELPILVILICYQILYQAGKQDPSRRRLAARLLEKGNALLEERLRRLPDEATRQRFLRRLPYNRQLRDLWLAYRA